MKLKTKKRIKNGMAVLLMLIAAIALAACGTGSSDEDMEFDEPMDVDSYEEEVYDDEDYEDGEFGPDDEVVMVDEKLDELVKIRKDGKYGALDASGRQVFPYEYEDIRWVATDRYVVSKSEGEESRTALVSAKNEEIVPFGKYDFVEGAESHIVATDRETGLQGYYSAEDNTWTIEPKYKEASGFQGPLTAVKDQNDRWGFINEKGEYVIQPKYKDVDQNSYYGFSFGGEAVKVVTEDDRTAFVLKTGKEIYPPKVKKGYRVTDYQEGLFVVEHGGSDDGLPEPNMGVANKKGKIIIPARYYPDELIIDEDKIAVMDHKQDPSVGVVNEWTTYDHKGKKTGTYSEDEFYNMEWLDFEDEDVDEEEYEEAEWPELPEGDYGEVEMYFENGLFLVEDPDSGDYGFVNERGEKVTEFKYKIEHDYC